MLGCEGPWLGARVSADPRPPPPPPPPSCSRRGVAATAVADAVAAATCSPLYPLPRTRRFKTVALGPDGSRLEGGAGGGGAGASASPGVGGMNDVGVKLEGGGVAGVQGGGGAAAGALGGGISAAGGTAQVWHCTLFCLLSSYARSLCLFFAFRACVFF